MCFIKTYEKINAAINIIKFFYAKIFKITIYVKAKLN